MAAALVAVPMLLPRLLLAALALVYAAPRAAEGHGFVIQPTIRNSVDKGLALWKHGDFPLASGQPGCTKTSGSCGCWCANGTNACAPGQSCLWFSQGCSIGCERCDGESARLQKDLCGKGMKAVVCDPRLRTYNVLPECNSAADTYKHNPWRAPGQAPTFDPCGRAGGGHHGKTPGPGAAFFVNTTNNKLGDFGSKVLPATTPTLYTRGQAYDFLWGMRANHGGGYQYRLCPAESDLTEDCFKANPLAFAGVQSLQYANGTRQKIPSIYAYENGTGVFTADGQVPSAGAWARNPIPDNTQKGSSSKASTEFPVPCADVPLPGGTSMCSGERPFDTAIVDSVIIPEATPPGRYVLGFRWDCEETAQIWQSCADVVIASA